MRLGERQGDVARAWRSRCSACRYRRRRAGAARRAARECRSRSAPSPGMTLTAPGSTSSARPSRRDRPPLGRAPRSAGSSRRRRRARRGATSSARRRRGRRRRAPLTSKRVAPLIAVTTPSGRSSASSTGPCSICNSTKAASLAPAQRRHSLGLAAETRQRLAHRDAVGVLLVERARANKAGERARAGQRRRESARLPHRRRRRSRPRRRAARRARPAPRRPRARRARRDCRRSGRRRARCRYASRSSAPARRPCLPS